MDILEKIREYRLERNWTEYQLAEKSGLPQSTISSWYRKNQIPTVPSLEKICDAFGVTLSQFFAEASAQVVSLTKEQVALLHEWNRLTKKQKNIILTLLKEI
ncbi:MAG: helix-turn-helix transcriptional regulator [Treponema sp.]|nr:helix-turn-helix transcriptional regulator [Treponema sp.]